MNAFLIKHITPLSVLAQVHAALIATVQGGDDYAKFRQRLSLKE